MQSPNVTMLDDRQRKRFEIPDERIPQDALVLYRPAPMSDTHRRFLLTTVAIVVVMAAMIVFLLVNVTCRRRAEKSSQEALLRQHELVRASSVGLWDWDLKTNRVHYSDEWKRQIGCEPHEIGDDFKEWESRVHPDDLAATREAVQASIASASQNHRAEFRFRHKNGAYRWILTQASVFLDSSGRPARMLGSHIDITERKAMEQTLLQSEARLRYILDSLPDMILEVDCGMNVLWANKSALIFNPDAVGQTCYRAFPGNDEICDDCYCRNVFASGRIEMGVMYQPASKTAGESYWENIGVPLKDHAGNVVSVLEVSRNVTDRELSRKRELKLQHDLFQSQKMQSIGNLAGGIAHDFNNILASIIGFTELALDEVDAGTPVAESLQEVYTASKRARDLVKQILTFARQSNEARKPVQPGAIAREVLQFIRSAIPTTIEIRQRIESASWVMGNETQVHQLLMNLCTNAAQAMAEHGGTLEVVVSDISARRMAGIDPSILPGKAVLEIRVADTGVGIAADKISAVFEPFYTTKAPGKGTGMGLAVVHGLVDEYGGRIRVESAVGKGTTFMVYLPVIRTPGDRPEASYQTADLPTGTERILFVDDEAALAKMGRRMLSRLGYSVTTQTSSLAALDLFRSRPDDFDLIVTDVTMPHMTGDQLAREAMRIRDDIPVVLCTGYSHNISEEAASQIGIKAFVPKPIVKADLARVVRQVLDETQT